MIERVEPDFLLPERELLDAWLEYHRATLRWKCEGLTDEQLKLRSVPPSTMSLLGLVRHMADVERNWFRRVLDDQVAPGLFWSNDNEEGEFDDVDDADVASNWATYDAEVAEAQRIVAPLHLDDNGVRRGKPCSVRWVYTHMIEEYARHNGHADLLRQCIDGQTGD
jgi:uncharacterized damage-inducible protein DinB